MSLIYLSIMEHFTPKINNYRYSILPVAIIFLFLCFQYLAAQDEKIGDISE